MYGGDQYAGREDSLLDPARDAAKIRAFFVHPKWARRGIGSLILEACEDAAREAGFTRLEMGATLSGVAFYRAKGYAEVENQAVPLGNGEVLPIVKMAKEFEVRMQCQSQRYFSFSILQLLTSDFACTSRRPRSRSSRPAQC